MPTYLILIDCSFLRCDEQHLKTQEFASKQKIPMNIFQKTMTDFNHNSKTGITS